MIKSFIQFINEGMNQKEIFIKDLTKSLIDKLRSSSSKESLDYVDFAGMEFKEPFEFNLIIHARRDKNPQMKQDSHFNDLPWERLNFDKYGYSIDANTKMDEDPTIVPLIEVHIIINPTEEPIVYSNLYYRLLDILTHETNHLDQLGMNRNPNNVHVSDNETRKEAKGSYKYFLLGDEVESMIEGMYTRSKAQGADLDKVFNDYLEPFLETDYITDAEYQKVMKTWIIRALELYPDAKFSNKAKSIIDSI